MLVPFECTSCCIYDTAEVCRLIQEMLGNVQEILSAQLLTTYDILSVLGIGNVSNMPNFLCTGNVCEILLYTVSGNVELSQYRNVHTMNRKFELPCTFHVIFQPRKFRISSSGHMMSLIIKILGGRYTCMQADLLAKI